MPIAPSYVTLVIACLKHSTKLGDTSGRSKLPLPQGLQIRPPQAPYHHERNHQGRGHQPDKFGFSSGFRASANGKVRNAQRERQRLIYVPRRSVRVSQLFENRDERGIPGQQTVPKTQGSNLLNFLVINISGTIIREFSDARAGPQIT